MRLMCCVAKLCMINWQRELVRMPRASGFEILMALFYVDDVRLVIGGFNRGYKWGKTQRMFIYSVER